MKQEEAPESSQPGNSQMLSLVADKDVAEHKEQQIGVHFSLVLRREESYGTLRRQESHSPAYKKKTRWLMLVGTVAVVCLILGTAMPEGGKRLPRIILLGTLAGFFV